jgi:hypothetical protein
VYEKLFNAKLEAAALAKLEADDKAAYENARAAGLLAGTISGKNETERDAAARMVWAAELAAWQRSADDARISRHQLDMAALAVEELRLLVRLDEMEAFAGKALPPSREG